MSTSTDRENTFTAYAPAFNQMCSARHPQYVSYEQGEPHCTLCQEEVEFCGTCYSSPCACDYAEDQGAGEHYPAPGKPTAADLAAEGDPEMYDGGASREPYHEHPVNCRCHLCYEM